jgi:hypothetical protein
VTFNAGRLENSAKVIKRKKVNDAHDRLRTQRSALRIHEKRGELEGPGTQSGIQYPTLLQKLCLFQALRSQVGI